MLYWLLYEQLGVNLFRYPSSRMLLSAGMSLLLSILLGPAFIRWLRVLKFGQEVRTDGPKTHETKKGTPTMGGTLIISTAMLPTLLWADLRNTYVWFVSIIFVGYGLVGFLDDYLKIALKNTKGLSGRKKLLGQAIIGLLALFVLFHYSDYNTTLALPLA